MVAIPVEAADWFVEGVTDFASAIQLPSTAVKTGQLQWTCNNGVWAFHHSPFITAVDDARLSGKRRNFLKKHGLNYLAERCTDVVMAVSRHTHNHAYNATVRRDVCWLLRTGKLHPDSNGMAFWHKKVVQGGKRYNKDSVTTDDDAYYPDTPQLEEHQGPIDLLSNAQRVRSGLDKLELLTLRDGCSGQYQCRQNAISIQEAFSVCGNLVAELRLPPYHGKNLTDAVNKIVTQVLCQLMAEEKPVAPSALALVVSLALHELTSGTCKKWTTWTKDARWNTIRSYCIIYYPADGMEARYTLTDHRIQSIQKLYFFSSRSSADELSVLKHRRFFCACDKCLNHKPQHCQVGLGQMQALVVRKPPPVAKTRGISSHLASSSGTYAGAATASVELLERDAADVAAGDAPPVSSKRRQGVTGAHPTPSQMSRLDLDMFLDHLLPNTVIALRIHPKDKKEPHESFFLGFTTKCASYTLDEAGSYGPGNYYEKGFRVVEFRWFEFTGTPEPTGDFLYVSWKKCLNVVVYTGTAIVRKAQQYLTEENFFVDTTLKGKRKGLWRLKREAIDKIEKYALDWY